MGLEPTTLRLLVPRSNQTELYGYSFFFKSKAYIIFINNILLNNNISKNLLINLFIISLFDKVILKN